MIRARVRKFFHYLAKIPIKIIILLFLSYITVSHFIVFSQKEYKYVPRVLLIYELHKKSNPHLTRIRYQHECNYNDLLAKNTMVSWSDQLTSLSKENMSTNRVLNGSFSPSHCNPLFSVAILVPYRNRAEHLDVFVPYMHDFLKKQKIHYKIFLIEQKDSYPFNKGVLYNAGARIAMEEGFPCLIFHNIDLLPLDHSNVYVCMNQPRHMSAAIDVFRLILGHEDRIGGALAIKAEQYKLVNGFSNSFDIGSGQDAEFSRRIVANGFEMQRFPPEMSRYHMLMHKPRASIAARRKIRFYTRTKDDGLNNVDTHVKKITVEAKSLYILIGVKLRYSDKLDVTDLKPNSYMTRDMVIYMLWTPAVFVLAKATFIWLRSGEEL